MWRKSIFLDKRNRCVKNNAKFRMNCRILYLDFPTFWPQLQADHALPKRYFSIMPKILTKSGTDRVLQKVVGSGIGYPSDTIHNIFLMQMMIFWWRWGPTSVRIRLWSKTENVQNRFWYKIKSVFTDDIRKSSNPKTVNWQHYPKALVV